MTDGTALVAGGMRIPEGGVVRGDQQVEFAGEVERFDPSTGGWSTIANLPSVGAGVEVTEGRVLFLGASDGYLLDPATGVVSQAGRLAMTRTPDRWFDCLRAVRLPDGRAVVHGCGAPVPELFTP